MSLSFFRPNTAENVVYDGVYADLEQSVLNVSDGKYLKVNAGSLEWATPNTANNVVVCDSSGFVPSGNLPSYVDDVLTFANLASFPATGETGKIYIALDTSYSYRWTGSAYFNISTHQFYNKSDVDTLLNGRLNLAGGTMTGDVNMGGHAISNAFSFDGAAILTSELRARNNTSILTTPNSGNCVMSRNLSMNTNEIINVLNIRGTNDACNSLFGSHVSSVLMQSPTIQCGNVGANNGSLNCSGAMNIISTNFQSQVIGTNNATLTIQTNGMIFGTNYGGFSYDSFAGMSMSSGINPFTIDSNQFRFTGLPTGTGTALVIDGGNVVRISSSAVKYKENIVNLNIDTSKIYNLQPKEYNFKTQPDKTTLGYLAHEMNAQFPLLCNLDAQGDPDSIKYDLLPILIIEEMKKLKDEIITLKNRVSILENQ